MTIAAGEGIVRIASAHSVEQTVARLQAMLAAKSVTLFALLDHSGEAARAGLAMPNTKLLIFGNPTAGTPVMLASPSSALDLPLKILVAEDAEGKTWISYNSAEYLQQRHGLPDRVLGALRALELLVAGALN